MFEIKKLADLVNPEWRIGPFVAEIRSLNSVEIQGLQSKNCYCIAAPGLIMIPMGLVVKQVITGFPAAHQA